MVVRTGALIGMGLTGIDSNIRGAVHCFHRYEAVKDSGVYDGALAGGADGRDARSQVV